MRSYRVLNMPMRAFLCAVVCRVLPWFAVASPTLKKIVFTLDCWKQNASTF